MKTDSVSFTTTQTIDWIADVLRNLAREFDAKVDRLIQDDIGSYGTAPGEIEVAFSGRVGLIGGLRHFRPGAANNDWCVQVYVHDRGTHREIELIALGESALTGITSNSVGVLNMGASREHRDKMAQALRPQMASSSSSLPLTLRPSSSQSAGRGQPYQQASYTRLAASQETPSVGQPATSPRATSPVRPTASSRTMDNARTASSGQPSNASQGSGATSPQGFASMQEMIRSFQEKQGGTSGT